MTEEEARQELEEITKELVYLKGKRYRTDWIEKNKLYRELCYKIGALEDRKKKLLDIIKKSYE